MHPSDEVIERTRGLRGQALAEATLAYIKAHPEDWRQEIWVCETAGCFAGIAVMLAGAKPIFEPLEATAPDGPLGGTRQAVRCMFDGHLKIIVALAGELLGLNHWDAAALFVASNTLEDLATIVETYITEGCFKRV